VLSAEFRVPSSQPPTPNPQPPITYTPPHLAERIRAEQAALEARSGTDGERKTITVLFADLKGSTALIEGLDPEEARAIIDPALQLMMDAVHQYDGYVSQALGDGIFALFGAPLAHEDHPQRALYAALRMQEAMRRYGDTLRAKGYPPLLMRVGINTGEVVLRSIRKDDLHADYVPVGHSTNLAARMEQLANPGTIVVSAYTHRLTDGYFAFKDLGPTQIKGVGEALNIYEVLGAGPLRTRLQVSARRGLTRFVGRHSEMEQLQRALAHAKEGHGQIVGTMGEPGLGKSRLFYEFKLLSVSGCLVLEAYSVSHGKATAYLPVIELLKSYFDIQTQDDERKRREKVAGKVVILDRTLEEILPYLYALLGIEEQPSPLAQMDAQIRRKRTFEALKKLFLRESLNQPVILIFEDLHWIDEETQRFLDVLSESVASAKLLLLTNYRPGYRHEWGQKTYYTQLRLAPLGRAEAEEFLDELLGETGSPLPRGERDRERVTDESLQALKHLILEKTQGTPFFMEEIVQELVEQGVLVRDGVETRCSASLPTDLHLPPTVQGILAARIDRLTPDEKALLQQLSVIGREFPLSLIQQVISQPEAELYRLLTSLQRKEFLYEQPAFPKSEYIFKHALTQEVAYGTVLQEQRKLLHERTAQAVEALYSTKLEDHYSELAHHYRRSNNIPKAVQYLHQAGQQAMQRSVHVEAISHFHTALELLETLPDSLERIQRELTLQVRLGMSLQIIKGLGSIEAGEAYARARVLSQQVGQTPQLFPMLRGLWLLYHVRAELQTARDLGQQLLRLAESTHDPALLLEAYHALGTTCLSLAEFIAARAHLEQGIALYDPQQHRSHAFLYGQDPGVACRRHLANVLWQIGYPDQARKRDEEALTLARELAHPTTLAGALFSSSGRHLHLREGRVAQERAEEMITLVSAQGSSFMLASGTIEHGSSLVAQGKVEEGIRQMVQGIADWQRTGGGVARLWIFSMLAEAYGKVGQIDNGLAVLAEALTFVEKTEEHYHEPELYRLKGELTLRQWKVESQKSQVPSPQPLTPNTRAEVEQEAEECFLKAIDVARRQQAKSLELRAVMSLARLWQRQASEQSAKSKAARAGNTEQESRNAQHVTRAKLAEAHHMLAEIYGWFTEGFDTKDLQEAKALLAQLS
jgi:class 3 adenylate cyclase/predicted ATPase